MKKVLVIFSTLILSTQVFANGGGSGRLKWECFMDIAETRAEREGKPLQAYGTTKENATNNVVASCYEYHNDRFPGLCDQYLQDNPESIQCQPNRSIVIPFP